MNRHSITMKYVSEKVDWSSSFKESAEKHVVHQDIIRVSHNPLR